MKRLLCVWLPNWPIQRVLVAQPELTQYPIVLSRRDPRRGQLVAACCRKARNQGVRVEMPFAEARALVQQATARPLVTRVQPTDKTTSVPWDAGLSVYDPDEDLRKLQDLAQHAYQFSPVVGLETFDSPSSSVLTNHPSQQPSSLLLEMANTSDRWGGEARLANQLAEPYVAEGYWLQMGIADTIGAAWALAHYRLKQPPLDTVTTLSQRRLFLQIARPQQTRLALASLPIDALRLLPMTSEQLQRLGIDQIRQLLELPRAGLATRLGSDLLHRLDQALGTQNETIASYQAPRQWTTQWHAEHPTERRDAIEQIVEHLVHRLVEMLAAQQQGALQTRCRLSYQVETFAAQAQSPAQHLDLVTNLFQPTTCADHLWHLLRVQLDATRVPGPLTEIKLTATATTGIKVRQTTLWDESPHSDARPLADLIDRLSNRLGANVVGKVRLCAEALPEQAYTVVPLAGPQANRARSKRNVSTLSPGQRPLQLLRSPLAIRVDCHDDGAPQALCIDQQFHLVQSFGGPERIETHWWRGPCIQRDYYRTLCQTGGRFWIYQDLANRSWFLHGFF